MRAIKIDSIEKKILEVWYNGEPGAVCGFLGCDSYWAVPVLSQMNIMIYIDDKGFVKDKPCFKIAGFPELIPSHGLVVGFNPATGEDIGLHLPIEFIEAIVKFVDGKNG